MRTQELINNELVTHVFEPKVFDPTRQQLFVMGNELGARLFVDKGQTRLSDGGRLAQNVANHLGAPVMAYLRPGTEGSCDPFYLAAAYQGLSAEHYYDTYEYAAMVGKTLRNRILSYAQQSRTHGGPETILVGKSAGCLLNAPIGAAGAFKTIAPVAGIYIESAGLQSRGGLLKARRHWETYNADIEGKHPKPPRPPEEAHNAEPASRWRQLRDMLLYGRLMASAATAGSLRTQAQPTYLELAELGMYSINFPGDATGSLRLVEEFADLASPQNAPQPRFVASVRTFHEPTPGAQPWRGNITHAYYNGSAEYAQAIASGLRRLGIWPNIKE